MNAATWDTPFWPEGVANTVPDYHFPLFKILDDSAQATPDNVYTIFIGATRTFAQVKETSDRIANFLARKGIKQGDRVAIFLPNIPQFPEIFFGILKAGACCVNCNPIYTASELNHQLNDSESKMVFCMDHPEFYPSTVQAIKGTQVETVVVCNIKSYLPKVKAFLGSVLGKIPKVVARAGFKRLADSGGEDDRRVQRLIMLGTPNNGSFSPVQALSGTHSMVRKVAAVDLCNSHEDLVNQVFNTFTGLYQMLPAGLSFQALTSTISRAGPLPGCRRAPRSWPRHLKCKRRLPPARSASS